MHLQRPSPSVPPARKTAFRRACPPAAALALLPLVLLLDAQTGVQAADASLPMQILITSDKRGDGADGWVKMNDESRNWVGGPCRTQLLAAGATLLEAPWPSIEGRADTNPGANCDQLLAQLSAAQPVAATAAATPATTTSTAPTATAATTTPAPTAMQILITSDKRGDGADGWVKMSDESRNWIGGPCRTRLLAAGATLLETSWASIEARPDTSPGKNCDQLLAQLSAAQPVAATAATTPTTTSTAPTATAAPMGDMPGMSGTPDTAPAATPSPVSGAADNRELIAGNSTRNTQYDDNRFRDVPMKDISLGDLTVNGDIYNEALVDTSTSGFFRVRCEVSHFAYDDPIVHPNQPGRAHLHMFFGNTGADAFSTFDSLLNSGTGTCNGEDLNRTAYWVPAMLDSQGNALIPYQIMVYYKNDNFRLNGANELVGPYPDGLRMIAGNAKATSPQTGYTGSYQVQPAVSFSCGPAYRSNDRRQALIPDCYGNDDMLEMQIAFPQCFDSSRGTYQADQSHMSYSEGGYYGPRCPDSHSIDVSSVMYRIFFRPQDNGGSLTGLHLSSDVKMDRVLPGGTTSHADWFGAWNPAAMAKWIENCNNTQADCETGLLDRDPAISLVLRKRGFYTPGYKAPASELVKLCPGKVYDSSRPLLVGMCRMS